MACEVRSVARMWRRNQSGYRGRDGRCSFARLCHDAHLDCLLGSNISQFDYHTGKHGFTLEECHRTLYGLCCGYFFCGSRKREHPIDINNEIDVLSCVDNVGAGNETRRENQVVENSSTNYTGFCQGVLQ